MIGLDNIPKQNGQVPSVEASTGIRKGEKVELLGPNRAAVTA